jgi:ABC-type multidrug transport system fused ATPase/permease subunit
MGILALAITFTSYMQNYLLISTAENVGARLKTQYLKSVLAQESAWYDQNNYLELASKMTREVETITAGIG